MADDRRAAALEGIVIEGARAAGAQIHWVQDGVSVVDHDSLWSLGCHDSMIIGVAAWGLSVSVLLHQLRNSVLIKSQSVHAAAHTACPSVRVPLVRRPHERVLYSPGTERASKHHHSNLDEWIPTRQCRQSGLWIA